MNAMRSAILGGSSLCAILPAREAGAADPCDFVTGSPVAFTQAQVMRCYQSVPFRRDDLQNITAVIEQHPSPI